MKKNGRILINAAGSACEGVEGGEELKDSMRVAETLFRPVSDTVGKVADHEKKRIKKKIRKKLRDSMIKKAVKEVPKKIAKKAAKETAKETTEAAVKAVTGTAATVAGAAAGSIAGPAGTAIGLAAGKIAGEIEGEKIDKRFYKMGTGSRIFSFFRSEMASNGGELGSTGQGLGENIFKTVGSMLLRNLFRIMKKVLKLFGRVLLALIGVLGVSIFPIILIVVLLYNSPFSIFLPKVTHTETVNEVAEEYYREFEEKVMTELSELNAVGVLNSAGKSGNSGTGGTVGKSGTGRRYDATRFEGVWLDDGTGELSQIGELVIDCKKNMRDVLLTYMVRYGVDDMAAEMNDKGKRRLREVFDDMVTISLGEDSYMITLERNILDEMGQSIRYPEERSEEKSGEKPEDRSEEKEKPEDPENCEEQDIYDDQEGHEPTIDLTDPTSYRYVPSGINSRAVWRNDVLVEIYDLEQRVKTVSIVLHGADEMAAIYDFSKKKMKIFNELKGMLEAAFPDD